MSATNNGEPEVSQVSIEWTIVPYDQAPLNQRLAWERLWAWLLRYEPDQNALDLHVSPVFTCEECCKHRARCICASRKETL